MLAGKTVEIGRRLLLVVAATAGLIIAARMLAGPFRLLLPVNTPLNAEGLFGLAASLALLGQVAGKEKRWPRLGTGILAAAVVLVAIAALGRALTFYFLSDDFILVRGASTWIRDQFWRQFTSGGGDGYYRPIGAVSLVASSIMAGFHPWLWHAFGLALHAANCVLVLLLARRLGASRLAGFFAAALYAIHGTRPEAVVWIAARFDLLATFFVLAGLLLFPRFKAAALAMMALAILSKEVGYVFPLLLLLFPEGRRWKVAAPFFAVAAALFAYRWTLFGGIGGYRVGGVAQVAVVGLPTLKALTIRLWAALYFPINWSVEPSRWIGALAIVYMIAVLWLLRSGTRSYFGFGFILISALPALQLLGIAADLGNSRVLYLPSVGFCLMLAMALDHRSRDRRERFAIAAVLLIFHFVALQHNLADWAYASEKTKAACVSGAAYTRSSSTFRAFGLPITLRGVPALANGFAECIEIEGGRRVEVSREGNVVLTWDRALDQIVCMRGCR